MNIKKYRKALGLTQTELAEKLGTTQKVITNYERGLNNPLASAMPDIAKALNIPIAALYGEDEIEPAQKTYPKSSRIGKLIEAFEKLPVAQQRAITQQAEALTKV